MVESPASLGSVWLSFGANWLTNKVGQEVADEAGRRESTHFKCRSAASFKDNLQTQTQFGAKEMTEMPVLKG